MTASLSGLGGGGGGESSDVDGGLLLATLKRSCVKRVDRLKNWNLEPKIIQKCLV